jgi:hypothetical protein
MRPRFSRVVVACEHCARTMFPPGTRHENGQGDPILHCVSCLVPTTGTARWNVW